MVGGVGCPESMWANSLKCEPGENRDVSFAGVRGLLGRIRAGARSEEIARQDLVMRVRGR